jgi:hypothetical protein
MIKLTQSFGRAVVLCAGLLFLFCAARASVRPAAPDLTNSVWKSAEEGAPFVLTFTQGKPETKGLVAILKGWGNGPLELRGEYFETPSETRLHIEGSYEGEAIAFNLRVNPGDHEQRPFLDGEFSIGSKVFSVTAGCDKQCPDIGSKKGDELATPGAASSETEFVGEWQDISEAIGFKEYWSIKYSAGGWNISGKFTKGEEVVGEFRGEEPSFDEKKGVLIFRQHFDQKPDENWLATNDIEATVQGNVLKFKVRGVEATLTRAPRGQQ